MTVACTSRKTDIPKNVILVTLDTQRSDHISAYNAGNAQTPNVDSLAQKGMTFVNCYSPIPITVPAHASLFYSLPPHELELYNNGQIFTNDKKLTSLARVFKKKGFRTAAFVSLGVLSSKFGLNDGFDDYQDGHPGDRWYLHAEEVNARVFPWIERNKQSPFFIWIHYADPHDPYAPPSLAPDLKVNFNGEPYKEICLKHGKRLSLSFLLKNGENTIAFEILDPYPDSRDEYRVSLNDIKYLAPKELGISYAGIKSVHKEDHSSLLIENRGQIKIHNSGAEQEFRLNARGKIYLLPSEKRAGYRAEVEYMDRQIGRLMKKLTQVNLLGQTLMILVGDHGEGLGDHKTRLGDPHFGHIHFLYDEYMKVPFIIHNPSLAEEPERREEITTILDVAPTVLGILGWKRLSFHKGADLFDSRNGGHSFVFGETYRPESTRDRFSGLKYPWHLIFTPSRERYELYNLRDDPAQRFDVFHKMNTRPDIVGLKQKVMKMSLKILREKKDIKLDPESLEMLRSLGYIE
jgi:arylsulfatase A-like enzyme